MFELPQQLVGECAVGRLLPGGCPLEGALGVIARAASFNGWCLARLAAVRAVASWRATQQRAKLGKLAPHWGR
jgi:hypothetical protein